MKIARYVKWLGSVLRRRRCGRWLNGNYYCGRMRNHPGIHSLPFGTIVDE